MTEQALHKVGKQLEKDEKKRIKSEVAELRKKASKLRADKLTEQELSELRAAMEQLKASSANAVRLMGEAAESEKEAEPDDEADT